MPDATQTADFAAREAALAKTEAELKAKAEQQTADFAERDKALKTREEALAQTDAERAREKALEFAEGHVQAGRILPRQKTGLAELLLTLPEAPLEFADGEGGQTVKAAPRTWLEQFLNDLPAQVDYSERTAGAVESVAAGQAANFSAPAGFSVNTGQIDLHRRASNLAKQKNIPYADAVRELQD